MTTPGGAEPREDTQGRTKRREDTPGRAQRREDTQPQSPVAVAPPLPNRRNSELVLLGFAAAITTVALLIVEANQDRGLQINTLSCDFDGVCTFGVDKPDKWRAALEAEYGKGKVVVVQQGPASAMDGSAVTSTR